MRSPWCYRGATITGVTNGVCDTIGSCPHSLCPPQGPRTPPGAQSQSHSQVLTGLRRCGQREGERRDTWSERDRSAPPGPQQPPHLGVTPGQPPGQPKPWEMGDFPTGSRVLLEKPQWQRRWVSCLLLPLGLPQSRLNPALAHLDQMLGPKLHPQSTLGAKPSSIFTHSILNCFKSAI